VTAGHEGISKLEKQRFGTLQIARANQKIQIRELTSSQFPRGYESGGGTLHHKRIHTADIKSPQDLQQSIGQPVITYGLLEEECPHSAENRLRGAFISCEEAIKGVDQTVLQSRSSDAWPAISVDL
jgi:hypothetical protein